MQDSGSIIITTKIKQQDFDKGIQEIQKKLEKLDEKASQPIEINGVKITGDWNLTEKEQRYYDRLSNTLEKLYQKKAEQLMQEGLISQENINQVDSAKELVDTYNALDSKFTEIGNHLNELVAEYNELTGSDVIFESDIQHAKELKKEIIEIIHKMEMMTGEKIYLKGFTEMPRKIRNIKKEIDNVGTGIKKVIKNVARWGLAIFGIRSAYMFIRQSMSTLSQYDDKLAADLEYIRYALASTLEPIIKRIIELVYKLLSYLGYIVKAWTGKDIFASANKGLSKANKGAKELKNQLAGFDEMNVLTDNSSGDSGVGPSVDLTKSQGDVPEWIKWIAENGELLLAIIAGIAAALITFKLTLDPLLSLGIGVAIAGIVLLIQDIIKFIQDPSWENFINILRDIAIVVLGIAIAVAAWPVAIGAAIALVVVLIIKYWDEIKAFLSKIADWFNENVIQPVIAFFGKVWEKIKEFFEPVVNFFVRLWNGIKEIFQPVIDFFVNIFTTIFENVKTTINNIKQIITFLWEVLKTGVKAVWNFIWSIIGPIFKEIYDKVIKPIKDAFVSLWEAIKSGFKGAFEIVKNVFNSVVTFFKNIIPTIVGLFKSIGSKVGEVIGGAFKAVINGVLSAIESILNFPIKSINSLIKTINKVPGINLTTLKTFSLPRLAKGGIINMPGRGVPVGSAIGGERGREGVIPLTDSQQMELLGASIGKYITINVNNVTELDGRQIARQVKQVNAESDFAFNR